MCKRRNLWAIAIVIALLVSRWGVAGVSYQDPAGGWQYIYQGTFNGPVVDGGCIGGVCPAGYGASNQTGALDGTWSHNQSSKWDGSGLGNYSVPNNSPTGTSPGGAESRIESGTNYIRLQDTGNPEQWGYIQGSRPTNTNRRIYFGHDMTQDANGDPNYLSAPLSQNVLDNGITISFRMRIPNSGTLDPVFTQVGGTNTNLNWFVPADADYNNNGAVDAADYVSWRKGIQPLANEVATIGTTDAQDYTEWRKRFGDQQLGRGYPIHDDGRAMITILQNNNTADPFDPFSGIDGTIAFSQVSSKDISNFCAVNSGATLCSGSGSGGLIMNNQSGDSPNNFIDSYDPGQTLNLLPIPDQKLKDWHEFWITIQNKTSAGNGALPGTHTVKVYMDGSTTPVSFQVTMSGNNNGAYAKVNTAPFIEFGLSSDSQFGSFDMDFLSYKLGIISPTAAASGLTSDLVPEPCVVGLLLAVLPGWFTLRLRAQTFLRN